MADVVINRTTDYDGSGATLSATGPILVTFSGTRGSTGRAPVLSVYSRSGTADYAPTYSTSKFGRFKVNLASGDDYYYMVSVESGTIDLADTTA